MDGQAVFKLAVGLLESAARATLAKANLTDADIDWLVPHQANIRIMQSTARKLKLSMDKVVVTVGEARQHVRRIHSAGAGLGSTQWQGQDRRNPAAGRRGWRFHLGCVAPYFVAPCAILTWASGLFYQNISMKQFAFVFPGQGSQSVGMLDAWG
jgi:hypothetical protein